MEQLLRLKRGMQSLSNIEFDNMTQSLGKQYLIDLIHDAFKSRLMNVNSSQQINSIINKMHQLNNQINTIVISREEKKETDDAEMKDMEEEITYQPIHFDELPSCLISIISSFLQFEDLQSLEICNYAIFIGTRSPVSLHQLSHIYQKKLIKYVNKNACHTYFHFQRFICIKKWDIDISDYVHVDVDNGYVDQNGLLQLRILSDIMHRHLQHVSIGYLSFDPDVPVEIPDEFFHVLSSLTCNVESLAIDMAFGLYPQFVTVYKLPLRLQFLYLGGDNIDGMIFPDSLKGLVFGLQDGRTKINVPATIESLHLTGINTIIPIKNKYNSLKEICFCYDPKQIEIDAVVAQNLNKLERINFTVVEENWLDDYKINVESIYKLISAPNINHISINASGKTFVDLMKILNTALKKRQKIMPCMVIRFYRDNSVDNKLLKEEDGLMIELIKILKNKTMDFKIFGTFFAKLYDPMNISFTLVSDSDASINITSSLEQIQRHKKITFVVKNNNCNIIGYGQKWQMKCETCSFNDEWKQTYFFSGFI